LSRVPPELWSVELHHHGLNRVISLDRPIQVVTAAISENVWHATSSTRTAFGRELEWLREQGWGTLDDPRSSSWRAIPPMIAPPPSWQPIPDVPQP